MAFGEEGEEPEGLEGQGGWVSEAGERENGREWHDRLQRHPLSEASSSQVTVLRISLASEILFNLNVILF